MRLYLLRHGRPARIAGTPASSWRLDPADDGIARLAAGGLLPASAHWYSSPEPKAVDTARALVGPEVEVAVVEELSEMRRPAAVPPSVLETDDFAAAVRRSFERPDDAALVGWETGTSTRARVRSAIERECVAIGRRTGGKGDADVVAVGHGTAWTLLVADLTATAVDVAAWERLSLPDLCVLDLDLDRPDGPEGRLRGTVVRPWGTKG